MSDNWAVVSCVAAFTAALIVIVAMAVYDANNKRGSINECVAKSQKPIECAAAFTK